MNTAIIAETTMIMLKRKTLKILAAKGNALPESVASFPGFLPLADFFELKLTERNISQ
jgi:hypothetical protein